MRKRLSHRKSRAVFSHHLFDAEKQGSEIGGIFQMPADVVGIGRAGGAGGPVVEPPWLKGGCEEGINAEEAVSPQISRGIFASSFRCGKTGVGNWGDFPDACGRGGNRRGKNTTHFPDGAFSDAGKYPRLSP